MLFGAIALATAGLISAAGPAAAATSCTISQYPAIAAGQSGLKVACTVAAPAPTALTYHDFAPATGTNAGAFWHPGAARVTAADGHATSGSASISSATGKFVAAVDLNHSITGAGIPAGAFIKSVTSATAAVLSAPATATVTTAVFKIENSSSRQVIDGKTTTSSGTLTSATANFQPGDVGKIVSGQGVKPGTVITARASTTSVTVSPVADATSPAAGVTLNFETPLESSTARRITDGHTTSGTTTVTSATALFSATDKGISITGPGIPANADITAVASATSVTISAAATATSTAAVLLIGTQTVTAPVNGEAIMQIGAELQLSPTLVASSDSCTENTPEGFVIQGKWQNPASFVTAGVLGTPPSNAIAQLLVPTSVVSFAGYVVAKAGGKYDVSYPLIPVGLANCATAPSIAATFTFNAITLSQGLSAQGLGVPGTNQVRALRGMPAATTSTATSASVTLGSTFTGSCTVTRQLGNPTFACGNG
jgi:hypothetical protein